MEDEEGLSQLSSQELDEIPSLPPSASKSPKKNVSRPPKKGSLQSSEYTLINTLKTPRATTYAASALNRNESTFEAYSRLTVNSTEQIIKGDIDLNPEYQRDVVWSTQKQINLIDSIFRNFYVPPVIFATHCHEDGSESRTCIDGKQRLTSIHLFMTGVIPHRDVESGQTYWFVKNPKEKGELLPEKYRQLFANKQVVCVEYQDLREMDERDIFTRVQLGMALTVAEKLQSISTPRADFIRILSQRFVTPETLGHPDIPWDRSRAREFQIIGTIIYCLSKWDKKTGLKAWVSTGVLEKWLTESEKAKKGSRSRKVEQNSSQHAGVLVEEDFKTLVTKTFEVVAEIAVTKRYSSPFRSSKSISPKVSPIEMVGAFILVHVVHTSPPKAPEKEMSLAGLSALFVLLRKKLREEHEDVRSNGRVGKTLFDFCLDASKDPIGTLVDGENAGLLEGEVEEGARWTHPKKHQKSTTGSATKKRKARVQTPDVETEEDMPEQEDDDVDDDERAVPFKRRRGIGRLSLKGHAGHSPKKHAKATPTRSKKRKDDSDDYEDDDEEVSQEPRPRRSIFSCVALPTPNATPSNGGRCATEDSPRVSSPSKRIISSHLPSSTTVPSSDLNHSQSPTDLSQSQPTPEQLLAAFPSGMVPFIMEQMKIYARGGSQMNQDAPNPAGNSLPATQGLNELQEKPAVKNEIGDDADPAQQAFATSLAQGIQTGGIPMDL